MSIATPGRRRNEEKHVPFNADPKKVGSRTGQSMPTNIPIDEDGFEDPSAFFRSPITAPDTGRTNYTRRSGPGTPGTGTTNRTAPPSSASVAAAAKRGRLSELDDGLGDDTFGDALGAEDLLVDDDFVETSTPFFKSGAPPSVSLPSRTRLPPGTPGTNYSALPSPSTASPRTYTRSAKKHSTIGVGYRPDKTPTPTSTGSPSRSGRRVTSGELQPVPSPGLGELEDDVPDEADLGVDEDEADEIGRRQTLSKRNRLSTRSGLSRADDGDVTMQSTTTGPAGQSFAFDADDIADDADVGMNFGDDAGAEDDEGEDEDVDMEQQAIDEEGLEAVEEEEEEEEETVEQRPKPKARGRPPKVRNPLDTRITAGSQGINKRNTAGEVIKRRTRISQIGGGEHNGVEGNFQTRRSGRQHMRPLAYWRGEKVEYKRGAQSAELAEVLRVEAEPVESFAAKRRRAARARRGRSRSTAPHEGGSMEHPEAGWDDETDPVGVVWDFEAEKEIERRIAYPQKLLTPKLVGDPNKGPTFEYQKVFGEDTFLAAGIVVIPPGSEKPGKASKDNAYVFFVFTGSVNVKIHRTSFVMAPGAQFLVPRGNFYSIVNVSQDRPAELFFAQSRKIRATDKEERIMKDTDAMKDTQSQRRSQSQSLKGRRSATQDGEGEEEEEEEMTPVQKKKKVGSKGIRA